MDKSPFFLSLVVYWKKLIHSFPNDMMGKKMCTLHMVAWWLVIVGALNWGLVGLFGWNLVEWLLGSWPMVERIVYVLVGASAVMALLEGKCKACMDGGKKGPAPMAEKKPEGMPQ